MSGERPPGEGGRTLAGRFRLERPLGRGSTGEVWSAVDLRAGRPVALKRLRAELAQDARLRRRLRREARAVARLEHPHIVRLYHLGVDEEGAPFLAMEPIVGPTLADLARDPDVGAPRLVALVEQVLGALAFAHARGVVHRDLKPHHIVVTRGPDGHDLVKLLDFGFARVENDSDDLLTRTRRDVFGTPTYMAPELATGEHETGPAADLYALGVVLWEALCGAPPFVGATATDVVVQHVTAPLPAFDPLPYRPVPSGVEAVLRRALEKEPGRRFDSAAAMRRALSAAFDADDVEPTVTVVDEPPVEVERSPTDTSRVTWAAAERAGAGGSAATALPEEAPLVGRDALQRWLWARVVAVCGSGQSRFVLLEGPTGIGKSRLCAWLGRAVAEGGWMSAVHTRFRAGVAPRGLRDVVRAALGCAHRPGGADALEHALAGLDPEGRVDRDVLAAFLWPGRGSRAPLGRAVRVVEELARRLAARRPLLVWLDDLEHADGEALRMLDHLAAQLTVRPAPVLVVGTRCTDAAPQGSAAGALASLLERHHGAIEVREVPPLGDAAAARLVQSLLPVPDDVTARVVTAARGNPLYVVEALQSLADARAEAQRGAPLPPTLVELVRRRLVVTLGASDDGTFLRGLAERLALLGSASPFDLVEALERASGVDAVRLETGLEGLVRAGVLVDEAGDAYAFVHEVVRRALLEEVAGRADAPHLHGRVAEAMLAWAGDRPERVAEEVARHLRAAGRLHGAVDRLVCAARTARGAGQYAEAAALYLEADRWLAEAEVEPRTAALRADALLGLAEAALDAGEPGRAERVAARLHAWAREARDARRTAQALCLCGEASAAAGRWHEARRLLEEARRLLAAEAPRLRPVDGAAAGGAPGAPRRPEACPPPGAPALGTDAAAVGALLARIDLARGRAALQAGALDEAQRLFAEAAAEFAAGGDPRGQAAAKRALGELAARVGDRGGARRLLAESAALAAGTDDHRLLAQASWRLGELLRQGGRLEEAAVRYRQAVEACEAAGDPAGAGRSLRGLGDTLRLLRRPDAERTYERAAEIFEALDDRFQLAVCFTQLGRLASDAGDAAAATSWFERALAHLERFDDPVRVGVLHALLARIAHRRGDAGARDHRLQAALRIDATHPLVVADWPGILEEVGEGLATAGERQRARRLFARAAEVWTALRRGDAAARCRARLAALAAR